MDAIQECLQGMMIACGPSLIFVAWMLWRTPEPDILSDSSDGVLDL
jgi:hypothetical protein